MSAQDPDRCRPVEVDGETVLVRGAQEMTEQDRVYLAEIVRAAKARYRAEHGEPPAEPGEAGR